MIDASVKVPEERLAEFYAMYGSWLKSPPGSWRTQSEDEFAESIVDVEPIPWAPDDLELAATVWAKFSPPAKALFSTLIDHPNDPHLGEELAKMHHIPNAAHGIAGVLTWPSRHCAAVGRTLCWKWKNSGPQGTAYWMDETLAGLFGQVRSQDRS
jgi:hypothetical protein